MDDRMCFVVQIHLLLILMIGAVLQNLGDFETGLLCSNNVAPPSLAAPFWLVLFTAMG
jgi:hypothetical protein